MTKREHFTIKMLHTLCCTVGVGAWVGEAGTVLMTGFGWISRGDVVFIFSGCRTFGVIYRQTTTAMQERAYKQSSA